MALILSGLDNPLAYRQLYGDTTCKNLTSCQTGEMTGGIGILAAQV